MFYGYGPLIVSGTWMTLQLALLSLAAALLLGVAGASARLSQRRVLQWLASGYTTLIRSVPDLVTMLLLFYSLQIALNQFTDWAGAGQIDIDPFLAGVTTLGIIYGAYFTETFRGAFLAVPAGQLEAGHAFGMSKWQVFHRILLPQMLRYALPGIGNNWLVLVKSTAIVSMIGLSDMNLVAEQAGRTTRQPFLFFLAVCVLYLLITGLSSWGLRRLEAHYSAGVRHNEF